MSAAAKDREWIMELARIESRRLRVEGVVAWHLHLTRNAEAVCLSRPRDGHRRELYVHPAVSPREGWQLTIAQDGMAMRHSLFPTREEAIRSASGEWIHDLPEGGPEYRITSMRTY